MKPIDCWGDTEIIAATQQIAMLRDALGRVSETIDNLPSFEWTEANANYADVAAALNSLFGEDWLQWLDVDCTPAEMREIYDGE